MNSRGICSRATGRRRAGFVALAAIFWLAQLQGAVRLLSLPGGDPAASRSRACSGCIASAGAGAARSSALLLAARALCAARLIGA